MKTKAVDEDEDEPRKMRSSHSKRRRHTRRTSSTESESPPRRRSKKPSKRTPSDKKSKRSKVSSSSRRRRRSPSPSPSLSSSSSPSSVSRSCSTCSSSSSEQSVSLSPPRSRSRDVNKRKGRGRERERRKARRSTSARSSTSTSSGSRSRNKSSKWRTKDAAKRDKNGKDYKKVTDSFDSDEEALVAAKKGRDYGTEMHEKNISLEKTDNPPSKSADETEDVLTAAAAAGGSPDAEDLELILRQKALDNFRKFRAAAAMAGKTDNGAARKETLTDSPQNAATKVTEARSASITPFRRQASSLGARHPTESPKSDNGWNDSSPRMQDSSAGMSHGAGSRSRILVDGDTGGPTKHEGSIAEATHSTSQHRSPQDGRNRLSVMQRLVHTPGSASNVTRRLGSSVGMSHVNGSPSPRIKSVVSIPARDELDGSNSTPHRSYQNPAPVESSDDVRCTPIDISTKAEGTNGDGRKTSELSASNGSIQSCTDGKTQVTEPRIEDTEGSQLQKKTFSRMHDGEMVEVSYKVYIPKKTPALARRKLQR